jgi:D-arabinose 5-phosphate isomerase GutQ
MKNIQVAKSVINNQIDGLKALCENIDDNFSLCVQEIIKSSGRVVLSGVGKSGINQAQLHWLLSGLNIEHAQAHKPLHHLKV